jgi:hypothetical protein
MFNPLLRATLLTAGCLCASSVLAADQLNIKTGLWEVTSTSQMSGTPVIPKELAAKMTPAQRAKMEADFKAAAKQPKKDMDRSCITKKDVENPFHGASENCKQSIVRTTSTTQEVRLVCTGEPKGTGFIRITTPNPETMVGVMDIRMGEGADALAFKADLNGRWLSADCGDEAEEDADTPDDADDLDDADESEKDSR